MSENHPDFPQQGSQPGPEQDPYRKQPAQDPYQQQMPPAYPQQTPPSYQPGPYQQQVPPQGFPQPHPGYQLPMEQKSKLVAGLLGIFLGSLGIHRFYLRHTTIGVVQLLLTIFLGAFTFGLVGLWGFVEGIMILCGAQMFRADARGIPLRD